MQGMSKLNVFSQKFADMVLAVHPEWRRLLQPAPDGSFAISISCPPTSLIQRPFVVTTENNEVTIVIDFCHTHFEWPDGLPGPFTDPLQHISAILSDEIAAVSYWKEGQLAGSTYIGPMDDLDLDNFTGRVRVRSWQGKRNRDIQVATGV